MLSLLNSLPRYWTDGAILALEGLRRGMSDTYPQTEDPPAATPSEVVYEGGKVRLHYYQAVGKPHATPILIVYSLIKRPFILDLQPGRSVVEALTKQGFEVYMIDWVPPSQTDSWRGFDAYVNRDLANAVRAVQIREEAEQVSLLGYCFGGLLTTLYTALHPENVKNLVTFTLPLDMSVQELSMNTLMVKISPETLNLLTSVYGNCPAWFFKMGFDSQAPVHHLLDKYVGLYRNQDREGYQDMFTLFERWLNSDVPMAGQLFREFTQDLSHKNALMNNQFQIAGRPVNLQNITCPVLNVIGEQDDIVHPKSSLPLADLVGGNDARTLLFPTGHIGAAVSSAAHKKLWPQVSTWFAKRDSQQAQ